MVQAGYFYNAASTKRVDTTFINMMYDQAMIGLKQPLRCGFNKDSLVYAAVAVNVYAGRQWSLDYFKDKLRMLQLRYETFLLVLEEPTLHWNEKTNRMQGRREDWKNFIRV
ncbi:UNVERIFIED_CONTAM: hypothetical protein Slati_2664100 [Sesamum latifolium]|uniref:Myb/SANT-like domain-containing protein n=1 Tax=Sesamum latifolium TaxID=2727402 RepID=A0AAW2VV31_9LAMI